jgi:hypothetical protein
MQKGVRQETCHFAGLGRNAAEGAQARRDPTPKMSGGAATRAITAKGRPLPEGVLELRGYVGDQTRISNVRATPGKHRSLAGASSALSRTWSSHMS